MKPVNITQNSNGKRLVFDAYCVTNQREMKLFQVNCTVKFCKKVKELVIWAYFDLFPSNFHQWYYKVLRVRLLCCYHPNQSTTAQSTLKYLILAEWKEQTKTNNYQLQSQYRRINKTFRKVVTHNNRSHRKSKSSYVFVYFICCSL